jgi:hypothetical protein
MALADLSARARALAAAKDQPKLPIGHPAPEPPYVPPGVGQANSPDRPMVRWVSEHQAAITVGYLRASLQRPPSWWHGEPHQPTPGTCCACCAGTSWWSRDRRGWCCGTCHPSATPAAAVLTAAT